MNLLTLTNQIIQDAQNPSPNYIHRVYFSTELLELAKDYERLLMNVLDVTLDKRDFMTEAKESQVEQGV